MDIQQANKQKKKDCDNHSFRFIYFNNTITLLNDIPGTTLCHFLICFSKNISISFYRFIQKRVKICITNALPYFPCNYFHPNTKKWTIQERITKNRKSLGSTLQTHQIWCYTFIFWINQNVSDIKNLWVKPTARIPFRILAIKRYSNWRLYAL